MTSRCHGNKISESQQTVVLKNGKKRRKKLTCTTFLCMIAPRNKTVAHTFLPSFASSRKIVEIQKVWFHGNVTSHFTSLSERISHLRNEKETGPSFAKTSGTVTRDRKKPIS